MDTNLKNSQQIKQIGENKTWLLDKIKITITILLFKKESWLHKQAK